MRRPRNCIVLIAFLLSACQRAVPPEVPSAAPAVFHNVTDMKQVMNWILEPNADVVWMSAGSIISEEGEQDLSPQTDEQWQAVRNAAATVAASGNILMLESYARDRGEWMTKARALIDASAEVIKAAEAKDKETLFTTGGDMYAACTSCHTQYVIGMPGSRVSGLEEGSERAAETSGR